MKRAGGALRLCNPIGIAADAAKALAHGNAVEYECQPLWRHGLSHRSTAERTAFFIRPDGDFEGMTGCDFVFVEGAYYLDGGQRSDVAVEVAAVRYRIDMRANENR